MDDFIGKFGEHCQVLFEIQGFLVASERMSGFDQDEPVYHVI
jgi:hypothetical protein